MSQQIETLQDQLCESETLAGEILEQYQHLLSWEDLYDDASPEKNK